MLFDYETFSECDLKKVGAYEYSMHPSTDLLCIGYKIGTLDNLLWSSTKLMRPRDWSRRAIDCEFIRALNDPNVILVAHNAFFERVITQNTLSRMGNFLGSGSLKNIDTDRWVCTAAIARTAGLPGSLDGASKALDLAYAKDKKGHALMLKLSRPREPTFENPSNRNGTPEEFERLYQYCIADIDAEAELFLSLPRLNEREQEFWCMDQDINLKGFGVDRELVDGALKILKRLTITNDNTIKQITGGQVESARQRDATLGWLKDCGVKLKNLKAQTVQEFLASPEKHKGVLPNAIRLLKVRQSASKSSTAKFAAFERRTRTDGRVRDSTMFYGAHTGRQSGTGIQPQNLFKSVIDKDDIQPAIEIVKNRDLTTLRALYHSPMNVLASLLRSCIVAPTGSTLDVGDFSTIEVRVLFWLAGHEKGLNALANGVDLYIQMAAKIYKVTEAEVAAAYHAGELAGIKKRQLGKQVVLGAGFGIGIGGQKFQSSAKSYGIDISLALASSSIRAYRNLHAPIPIFWETIEAAAIKAVKNPGKEIRHGYLAWKTVDQWLTCTLPIGRKLYYYQPQMQWITNKNGKFLTLTYMGVDSVSKKFMRLSTWGGKLTENVVQAISRDLLYEAMGRLKAKGHTTILAVHDEIITERELPGDFELGLEGKIEMLGIMEEVPVWAHGLPIKVEGWSEPRYRK